MHLKKHKSKGFLLSGNKAGQEEIASSFSRGDLDPILGKDLFTKKVIKQWNRLPREVFESPSLKMFRKGVDMALGDMV